MPKSRIDDAVRRILRQKFEAGLFEHPFADRRKIGQIGSQQHRRVAREAAAKSQVLLKNRHRTLPLSKRDDVYVAGAKADSIGDQAGGWTITWQGNSTHQIPGETILDGIERLSHGDVTYSKDASAPVGRRDHGVVVVGETPYAEGFGDVGGPRWGFDPGENGVLREPKTMKLNDADRAAVDKVCAAAKDCTVIVVSGRPLEIDPAQLRRSTRWWRRGCRAAKGPASPTRCSAASRTRASCRSAGRSRSTRSRSTSATRTTTRCIRSAGGCARASAYARQWLAVKRTSTGMISSRPRYISDVSTPVQTSLNGANEPIGPAKPSPGPRRPASRRSGRATGRR